MFYGEHDSLLFPDESRQNQKAAKTYCLRGGAKVPLYQIYALSGLEGLPE